MKKFASIFVLCLTAIFLPSMRVDGQAVSSLSQVKKVYVEPFSAGDKAGQLRVSLSKRLQKSGKYTVVDTPKDADAIVKGNGQIWVKGYFTTNARAPATNREAIYGGFLSVEIVSKNGEPLWSYLVTPSKMSWRSVADDLATSMVKELVSDAGENAPSAVTTSGVAVLDKAELSGAGATFPAPLYTKWFHSFEDLHPGVQLHYEAVGSDAGLKKLAENKVDFAAADISRKDDAAAQEKVPMRRIASVLGGVVPIYNLEGVTQDLKFTPAVLANIYLGKIKKWNDPEIRKSNGNIDLPDRDIVIFHRSDGSGTTYVWSDFLSRVSPGWKSAVGVGSTLTWPTGTGAQGNEALSAAVQNTPNSIGYTELVYAIQHQLSFGAVQNSSGEYVRASLDSVAEAARTAGTDASSSIINAPGKNAYPIASFTWLFFPQAIADTAKKAAIEELIHWILTSGQKECSALGYAPLPREVINSELNMLSSYK